MLRAFKLYTGRDNASHVVEGPVAPDVASPSPDGIKDEATWQAS